MSDEEEQIGNEFDRALRAAAMGAGQVVETLQRLSQDRDRKAAEQVQQLVREQERVTAGVREQVGRSGFWKMANGEAVANAATYGATMSEVDPRGRDIYEIVREQAHDRYGVDVDSLRAQFPNSEEQQRNALMHAVDDFLAAKREGAEAEDDRAGVADLEQEGSVGERGHEEAAREHDAITENAESSAELGGERAAASEDAAEHDQEHDRLYDRAHDESTAARGYEHDTTRDTPHGAGEKRTTVREILQPSTAAGKASQVASTSYPESANQTLAKSKKGAQPKARINRGQGQSPERERTRGLGR
ncbi:hypothetical protein ITJ38_17450 [Agreia pratensis]|uniref:hypothetical protein n=1 Tax=Agreia pratensis TaxID=150121 RepID=UPI00188C2101|nr:hypothetical protein [Agreia pratensis]MBF4636199.1 hypothetical protein [Agreia pratensis]